MGPGRRSSERSTLLVLLLLLSGARGARADVITVSWDPSPDPQVIGYLVYVGTQPGTYRSAHDAGRRTWFTYDGAEGQTYYFAVASYAPGPVIGPLSDEVTAPASRASPYSAGVRPSAPSMETPAPAGTTTSVMAGTAARLPSLCATDDTRRCFATTQTTAGLGEIGDVTALPDGRVLIVEDGRRVRVVADGRLLSSPALDDLEASLRLTHLAVDPYFSQTGIVMASVVETARDGRQALYVIRYRALQDQLGEPAVIVAGLPISSDGGAPLAMDRESHVYLALPAAADMPGSRSDSGSILRFNVDGSVPRSNVAGSPLFARGPAGTHALAWLASPAQLIAAGRDAAGSPTLVALELGARSAASEWPRIPRVLTGVGHACPAQARRRPFATARASAAPSGADTVAVWMSCLRSQISDRVLLEGLAWETWTLDPGTFGRVSAISVGPHGETYVGFGEQTPAGMRGNLVTLSATPP